MAPLFQNTGLFDTPIPHFRWLLQTITPTFHLNLLFTFPSLPLKTPPKKTPKNYVLPLYRMLLPTTIPQDHPFQKDFTCLLQSLIITVIADQVKCLFCKHTKLPILFFIYNQIILNKIWLIASVPKLRIFKNSKHFSMISKINLAISIMKNICTNEKKKFCKIVPEGNILIDKHLWLKDLIFSSAISLAVLS